MNRQSSTSRLPWGPVALVAGFAFAAVGLVTIEMAPVRAQEKAAAKSKAATGSAANKKSTASPTGRKTPAAGQKMDAVLLAKWIDGDIDARLRSEGVKPSNRSGDAEFLRRLSLDLVSAIPSPDEVAAFLDDTDPSKRAKAIDKLLDDPRFGNFQAEIWAGVLLPRDSNNRLLSRKPFYDWLAKRFNRNVPLNRIVSELLTAKGTQEENGAVTYFLANPEVDKMTDTVSRMFLGVQLQCAQCHNHPFTDWKQAEFWGMAQFFSKVRVTVNPQMAAKQGVSPAIAENNVPAFKKGVAPEGAMKVNAKFLGGAEPKLGFGEPYRPVLAKWIESPDNPYFARAMANRFWGHFFGRGLVSPVDDMHENNLPTHPELLDVLAEQLKANDFDLKLFVRAICNSETYQRTSRPNGNGDDREYYSHRLVRALLPEQLYESVVAVVGKEQFERRGPVLAAFQKKGFVGPRDQFVNFFRVSEDVDVLDYQIGIPQVLRLMNSSTTNLLGGAVSNAIKVAGADNVEKVVERLYLTGLSRRPTDEETRRMVSYVREHPINPIAAYTDILWSMMNSSEFVLNH